MSHFDAARRAALMADLVNQILERPVDLLPFDEVREHLRLRSVVDRGVQDVRVEQIAGTLGREREFTRAFLPREESLRERWEEVEDLAEGPAGFPPVELYKVGEAYFVVDGHHRVSVARTMGAPTVEAHVKEFATPVSVEAGESLENIVLKRGLADFLEATGLAPERPDEFRATTPNAYERMLDHIGVHRYYRGIELGRPVSWEDAVASWRDSLFRPVVETIHESGVLHEFPGRTEADLYLFVMDHLAHLKERYGRSTIRPRRAVEHFAAQQRRRTVRPWDRLLQWWRRRRRDGKLSPRTW